MNETDFKKYFEEQENKRKKWNDYQRKWREKNPQKVKEYRENYIVKKAQEIKNERV